MIIDDGMMWHLMRGAWLCLQPVRACVSLEPGLVPRDPVLRCHPHSMDMISLLLFLSSQNESPPAAGCRTRARPPNARSCPAGLLDASQRISEAPS
jgi:hypothetical protein